VVGPGFICPFFISLTARRMIPSPRWRTKKRLPPRCEEHHLTVYIDANPHPTLVNGAMMGPALFRLPYYSDSEN